MSAAIPVVISPHGELARRAVRRHMKLSGVQWIRAPRDYVMVGLDGRMTASGETISGYVPDLFGCTDFEIHRPLQLVG